jgi:hypothetical protein
MWCNLNKYIIFKLNLLISEHALWCSCNYDPGFMLQMQ